METLKVKLASIAPLLMHSDKLANPLHPDSIAHKSLTAKRKKVQEDHLAIAKSEFMSGVYWNEKDGVHLPGNCIDACLLAGAKLQKLGTHWKRGCLVLEERVKLQFDGPATPAKLWDDLRFVDCRGVKVGTAKIMRYRPIFREWAASFTLAVNTDILDIGEVKKAVADAGALIGLCDFRPRFGRFEVSYG